MRVGLNLLYLIPGVVGGTETYARSLIEALAAALGSGPASEVEFIVFLNEESTGFTLPRCSRFSRVVCPLAATNRVARYAWEQRHLPQAMREYGIDVLHSLGYVGPVFPGVPHVISVHDTNFLCPSVTMPLHRRIALGAFTVAAARRAAVVLTISEFSRGEIIRKLRLRPSRVMVTPLAADAEAADAPSTSPATNDEPPRILAFASIARHKNVPALIEASGILSREYRHTLRIIGRTPPGGEIQRAARRAGPHVQLLGYIPDRDVSAEMRAATMLAVPSLYEGFGLPVLRAQALGLPVACARAGALPEVSGGAAVLFDPRSVNDIADALMRVLRDKPLRRRLAEAGYKNAAAYCWNRTARLTLEAYTRAALGSA